MQKSIKLMAEYGRLALWWAGSRVGPIDPGDLPISTSLRMDIQRWADEYDGLLDQNSPIDSGFPDAKAEQEFDDAGRQLWKRLQAELASDFMVLYFSEIEQRLLAPVPEERGGHTV